MKETIYHGFPTSLALLTDLHNADPTPVLSSLRAHSPSLICVVGDILLGRQPEGDVSPLETQKNVLPFLSSCASIAPTFVSLGNHEWMLDSADLETVANTGVTVLDNRWVEKDGVILGGLTSGHVTDYRRFKAGTDGTVRYPQRQSLPGIRVTVTPSEHKPDISWLAEYSAQRGFHILMTHHPEYWPMIRDQQIDLAISGHAHGGQIRLLNHGLWSPGQGWWPKYTKGVYEGRMIVSAGLTNTTWVPRIGNSTELVYVE